MKYNNINYFILLRKMKHNLHFLQQAKFTHFTKQYETKTYIFYSIHKIFHFASQNEQKSTFYYSKHEFNHFMKNNDAQSTFIYRHKLLILRSKMKHILQFLQHSTASNKS